MMEMRLQYSWFHLVEHVSSGDPAPTSGLDITDEAYLYHATEHVLENLERHGQGQFVVRGFGLNPWPVDLSDFHMLLEELPNAVGSAERGERFELPFWDQAIQTDLLFTPDGNAFRIQPTEPGPQQLDTEPVQASRQSVVLTLRTLLSDFTLAAVLLAPTMTSSDAFIWWLRTGDFFGAPRWL